MKPSGEDWDGQERRSGEDRRKGERRDPDRSKGGGVLTTRKSERRNNDRRANDRKNKENPPQSS